MINSTTAVAAQQLLTNGIEEAMRKLFEVLSGKKRSDMTGDRSVLQSCFDEDSGRVRLEEELRVYEFCPPDGELFKDFVVP